MRSTRVPEAGNGDGDGDGDGDVGDGDGDGDVGDGDGDGDGDDEAPLEPIDRQFVPRPEGLRASPGDLNRGPLVVGFSDDGHVLMRDPQTADEAGERAFVWRGSGKPELIAPPPGIDHMRVACLLTGNRSIIGLPELNEDTGAYSYSSLLPMIVKDGVATALMNPEGRRFQIVRCNEEGQALAAGGIVLGSGPPIAIDGAPLENLGFNSDGMALYSDGFWNGEEIVPFASDFKPYSGPSEDGVVLGSVDEFASGDETQALLWDVANNKRTIISRIPLILEVPEPILIGPEGDVVVGTGIADEEPNAVYLYRNGKFALLGVEDEDFGEVLFVNAKGQVLIDVLQEDAEKGHAAVLFTPRN